MLLDFHVQAGTRFSLQDKRLFEISEVKIARVNCIHVTCLAHLCILKVFHDSFSSYFHSAQKQNITINSTKKTAVSGNGKTLQTGVN